MPWILTNIFDVANTAPEGVIPDSVRYSFYLGAVAILLAVGWTIIRTREYSPEELESFYEPENASNAAQQQASLEGTGVFSSTKAAIWTILGLIASAAIYFGNWDYQLYILSIGVAVFGLIQFYAATLESRGKNNGFYEACRSVVLMPKTMRQLAVVQFFSWFPLFAMWIFTTPAVTSFHFGSSDPQSAAYNEGANWVGVLFGAYNGFSVLAALLIPIVVRKIGLKTTHQFNLFIGALGLASIMWLKDPTFLLLSMVGVGFAWASILSVPYAILSDAVPAKKMGIYMGVFNFFIVIPQLVAASLLGLALKYLFGGESIYILGLAAALWVVAAVSMFFVQHSDEASPVEQEVTA